MTTPSSALRRPADYPISRWYLRPAAVMLAVVLARTSVRPWHVTACGAALAALAAAMVLLTGGGSTLAAFLVLAAWFCDRLDGCLARRQRTATRWGAWLDANLDELADVGLHTALALAAATASASSWPWALLIVFLTGKYLFMYGLWTEDAQTLPAMTVAPHPAQPTATPGLLRSLYHLPANADVRVHLLALAVLGGWFTAELFFVASYYNLRWLARYGLVIRRLGDAEQ